MLMHRNALLDRQRKRAVRLALAVHLESGIVLDSVNQVNRGLNQEMITPMITFPRLLVSYRLS